MIFAILPEITITNPDNETLTYFDPKNPGGDVDRLLSLLDGEHYEVISSLQDQDAFCHRILPTGLQKYTISLSILCDTKRYFEMSSKY